MRSIILIFLLLTVICRAFGSAQTRFTDQTEGYVLELPSPEWRAVARPDVIHPHTDFIYGKANNVRLRIRLKLVDESASLETIVARDEERRLRFLPGFIGNNKEKFGGKLNGIKITYEYAGGGKAVAARVYYLEANNRMIYVLRFVGTRTDLEKIRDDTDSIARSFHLL